MTSIKVIYFFFFDRSIKVKLKHTQTAKCWGTYHTSFQLHKGNHCTKRKLTQIWNKVDSLDNLVGYKQVRSPTTSFYKRRSLPTGYGPVWCICLAKIVQKMPNSTTPLPTSVPDRVQKQKEEEKDNYYYHLPRKSQCSFTLSTSIICMPGK